MQKHTKAPTNTIRMERGNLYISAAVYERYLKGIEAVILLERDNQCWLMPIRNAMAGGYLLKRLNSQGDRVIHAADFFRDRGIDDVKTQDIEIKWNKEMAALGLSASIMQT